MRASLRQAERDPMPAIAQLAVLVAAMDGYLDGLGEVDTLAVMATIRAAAPRDLADIAKQIAANAPFTDAVRGQIAGLGKQARDAIGAQNGTIA